jgi:hypothetical protein
MTEQLIDRPQVVIATADATRAPEATRSSRAHTPFRSRRSFDAEALPSWDWPFPMFDHYRRSA